MLSPIGGQLVASWMADRDIDTVTPPRDNLEKQIPLT